VRGPLTRYDVILVALGLQRPSPLSRALLEGKFIRNPMRGAWASIYEMYVVVVIATTLLLKLDAQVNNWASRKTSLGG